MVCEYNDCRESQLELEIFGESVKGVVCKKWCTDLFGFEKNILRKFYKAQFEGMPELSFLEHAGILEAPFDDIRRLGP